MLHDDVATALAGDGLAASSGVLAVQVSGAVKIASDKVFKLAMQDADPKIAGWKIYSSWKAVDLFGNSSIVPTENNI